VEDLRDGLHWKEGKILPSSRSSDRRVQVRVRRHLHGFPCEPIVSPRQTARKRYWRIYCGCPEELDEGDRPEGGDDYGPGEPEECHMVVLLEQPLKGGKIFINPPRCFGDCPSGKTCERTRKEYDEVLRGVDGTFRVVTVHEYSCVCK
jgi:hypothetical protein